MSGVYNTTRGAGHSTFFWWMCASGFQIVGLGSWFSLKNRGLRNKNFEKFGSRELDFGQNKAENAKITKNWKQGAQERRIDGKLVS